MNAEQRAIDGEGRRNFLRMLAAAPAASAISDRAEATTTHEAVSEKIVTAMKAADVKINAKAATVEALDQLFDPTVRQRRPAVAAQSLQARHCEEHLAVALACAAQALNERAGYYALGEKFATVGLGLYNDLLTLQVLELERGAFGQRRDATQHFQTAEEKAAKGLRQQSDTLKVYIANVNPVDQYAKADAERVGSYTYMNVARTHSGPLTKGHLTRKDAPPISAEGEFGTEKTLPLETAATTDLLTDVARRMSIAGSRLAHYQGLAEREGVDSAAAAAAERAAAQEAMGAFEETTSAIAEKRKQAVADLRTAKVYLSYKTELYGFETQMKMAKARIDELLIEAQDRARLAKDGVSAVYKVTLNSPPPVRTVEDIERFLMWCRASARQLLPVQDRVVTDRIVVSLRAELGDGQWRTKVSSDNGASIDLTRLGTLGTIVVARDVALHCRGEAPPRQAATVTLPPGGANAKATALRLFAQLPQPLGSAHSVARMVHNRSVAGSWVVQYGGDDLSVLADLLLEVQFMYVAAPSQQS